MNEEENFGDLEEQAYKDHLKRIGKNLILKIEDELKRINFIQHYYSNFAGHINTEILEDAFVMVSPVLEQDDLVNVSSVRLENTIKTLKYVLYGLRSELNTFEEKEGLHYEIGLAELLARKGNIDPEQVAPLSLKSLPDMGSIGGKKRKPKTKKYKKKHKKTKKHK